MVDMSWTPVTRPFSLLVCLLVLLKWLMQPVWRVAFLLPPVFRKGSVVALSNQSSERRGGALLANHRFVPENVWEIQRRRTQMLCCVMLMLPAKLVKPLGLFTYSQIQRHNSRNCSVSSSYSTYRSCMTEIRYFFFKEVSLLKKGARSCRLTSYVNLHTRWIHLHVRYGTVYLHRFSWNTLVIKHTFNLFFHKICLLYIENRINKWSWRCIH